MRLILPALQPVISSASPLLLMTNIARSPRHQTILSPLKMWSARVRCTLWSASASILLVALIPLHAEPLMRGLGENLRYFRAHVLPTDLPAADVKTGPLILDLRYTLAEADATTALDAWLKFRATATTPVFVLLNADTAPALRELLMTPDDRIGVITIGRASSDITPDIAIDTTNDDERHAYEALEKNSPIESLITDNADKPRTDEASIMSTRREPNAIQADATPAPPDRTAPAEKKSEPTPPPVIDRAIQRAVQLHRALLALKRL